MRLSVAACIIVGVGLLLCCNAQFDPILETVSVKSGGTSAARVLFQEWEYLYSLVQPNVVMTYISQNTQAGINGVINKTLDFAGVVETAYFDAEIEPFPIVGVPIVLLYNLPTSVAQPKRLILDRQAVVDIFLGNIVNWNDQHLLNLNQNRTDVLAALQVAGPIKIATRSDVAGATAAFSGALNSFSPAWAAAVNPPVSPTINWPVATTGVSTSAGMINYVRTTSGSIGYTALSDVLAAGLPYADMINKAGSLVTANSDSVQSAMEDFQLSFDVHLATSMPDGPGAKTWPMAAYTYVQLYMNVTTQCEVTRAILDWIVWAETTEGTQQRATDIGFAALTPGVLKRTVDKFNLVRCQGERALASNVVVGSGATLPASAYSNWARLYTQKVEPTTIIDYLPVGSSAGVSDILQKNSDFAGSDSILTPAQYTQGGDLQMLPILGVAVVPIYNLPGISTRRSASGDIEERLSAVPLTLDSAVLAAIYTGNVTQWNDPSIGALNPGFTLPSQPIQLVVRSDGSGTSNVLSDYVSIHSPIFASAVGRSNLPNWSALIPPARITASDGPAGVLTSVSTTPYSLGYVSYVDYLEQKKAAVAAANMINPAGTTVTPAPSAVRSAMVDFQNSFTPELTVDLLDGPSVTSWPISTYTYIIVRNTTAPDCIRLSALLDFLTWSQVATKAEEVANKLGYSVTPIDVRSQLLVTMSRVTCQGRSVFSLIGCFQGGEICSFHGGCVNNKCVCDQGYEGTYCEDTVSDSSDNTTSIVLGTVLGVAAFVLLCCFLCLIVVFVVVLIMVRKKNKYARLDKMWLVDWSEIQVDHQIGAGNNGAVHHASWKGVEVAVKVLGATLIGEEGEVDAASSLPITRQMKAQFIEEAALMTTLRHPNVVLFMGACAQPPAIIMAYMRLGSVYDVLHNEYITNIPLQRRVKMALQTAQGMYYLHSVDIIHRDLKSLNLLMDEDWNVKVSDFGLTTFKEQLSELRKQQSSRSDDDQQPLSIFWTAPEIFEDPTAFSVHSDTYSYGIILWELLTRKEPYEGMSPTAVAVAVVKDQIRPPVPSSDEVPEEILELMESCWDQTPADRPDFQEIISRLQLVASSSHSSTGSGGRSSSLYPDEDRTEFPEGAKGIELVQYEAEAGVAPPQGAMAILFSDIYGAAALWEAYPSAMKEATLLHNQILREAMAELDGYEVALRAGEGVVGGEGSFCVAFQKSNKAISWCVAVQERLIKAKWPKELLNHPNASVETDNQDQVVFCGLRVRMGLNYGTPRAMRDPVTHRIEYIGTTVTTAARLATIAQAGQIVVSENLYGQVHDRSGVSKKGTFVRVGKVTATNSEDGDVNIVYEFKPHSLAGRFFSGMTKAISKKDPKKGSSTGNSFTDSEEESNLDIDHGDNQGAYLSSANLCRWIINYKHLTIQEKLGSGNYGMVYHAKWKGVDVAVKKLIKQRLSEKRILEFRAEIAMLSELRHPNIVMFIGASVKAPNMCIVTEYMAKGSLKDVLKDKSISIDWLQKLRIGQSIVLALSYLHSLEPSIIHRDLKPANVLIDENWNTKLCDFGFAKIKEENVAMTRCGTPSYLAPEIIRGEAYDESVDIYAFGMILWELLTRARPYAGQNFMSVTMDVLQGVRPQVPPKTPSSYTKIMKKCWAEDPKKRPSLKAIRQYYERELGTENA